ncbi:MAG: hypothetical protein RMM53_02115, partial [Bacteroidia bacterium]|nr:hypothetical protein [Bacteroidia bacterium]
GVVVALVLGTLLCSLETTDARIQIETARNWTQGKGFVFFDSKSGTYHTNMLWPPSYMLFLGVLMKAGLSGAWAMRATWILSATVFVASLGALARLFWGEREKTRALGFTAFSVSLWTLGLGLDMYAAAWMLSALWLLSREIMRRQFTTGSLALNCVVWLGAAVTRYNYFPLLAVPVLAYVYIALTQKQKYAWKRAGAYAVVLGILFATYQAAIRMSLSGDWNYVAKNIRGFYPENLLHFSAYLLDGWGGGAMLLHRFRHVDALLVCAKIASFLVTVWIVGRAFVDAIKNRTLPAFLTLCVWALVLLPLVYLSLTVKAQDWLPGGWTYVQSSRYLIVPITLSLVYLAPLFGRSVWGKGIYAAVLTVHFLQSVNLTVKIFVLQQWQITNLIYNP